MKIDSIILIENKWVEELLYPFSILHCGFEVRCGSLRLFEKIQYLFPDLKIHYFARDLHLKSFLARENICNPELKNQNVLILDSSLLFNQSTFTNIISTYQDFISNDSINKSALFCDKSGIIIGAYLQEFSEELKISLYSNPLNFLDLIFNNYPHFIINNTKRIEYLWDCLTYNSDEIENDIKLILEENTVLESSNTVITKFGEYQVLLDEKVTVTPGVIFDTTHGSIIIGKNVLIMPNSVICGPCSIGDNSIIKIGSKIYEGCSFGPLCKIGGEIENSIIHSYSNKQHEGFLGHSYISEWVNLGADTNTSDLKNTYAEIKVTLRNRRYRTNRNLLGLLCGDHTKSAINTSFTTGSVIGVSSMIALDNTVPSSVNSFSWLVPNKTSHYDFDKAMDVARIVMRRRNKDLLPEELELLRQEFDRTTK